MIEWTLSSCDAICTTYFIYLSKWGRRGCWCCEFEFRSGRGVQHYVIKIVSDLRQVGGWNIVESDVKHHKPTPNHNLPNMVARATDNVKLKDNVWHFFLQIFFTVNRFIWYTIFSILIIGKEHNTHSDKQKITSIYWHKKKKGQTGTLVI